MFLCLILTAAQLLPEVEKSRSLGPMIAPLAQELKPDDLLATLGDYWHGTAFYARRRVVVADNWGELDFGRRLDPGGPNGS